MAVLQATSTTTVAAAVVEIWVLPATLTGRRAERAWRVLSEAERVHARSLAPG